MNAGVRNYAVPGLYTRDQLLLLFLSLFLWPDHHEIHDDENENERHKEADAAGRTACRSGGLCLSQERVEHIKNWRAHLKPERLRCNSSLSFPLNSHHFERKSSSERSRTGRGSREISFCLISRSTSRVLYFETKLFRNSSNFWFSICPRPCRIKSR